MLDITNIVETATAIIAVFTLFETIRCHKKTEQIAKEQEKQHEKRDDRKVGLELLDRRIRAIESFEKGELENSNEKNDCEVELAILFSEKIAEKFIKLKSIKKKLKEDKELLAKYEELLDALEANNISPYETIYIEYQNFKEEAETATYIEDNAFMKGEHDPGKIFEEILDGTTNAFDDLEEILQEMSFSETWNHLKEYPCEINRLRQDIYNDLKNYVRNSINLKADGE